jgi:hypothetical protein
MFVVASPPAVQAQVVVDEQPAGDDGGPEAGDPDQPNLKPRSPVSSVSPVTAIDSRTGRSLEPHAGKAARLEDRSPRGMLLRGFEWLYAAWRARWGW